MSTKSLAMFAAVLGALLFIGGEAKWYSAIDGATIITGPAGVVDGNTVVVDDRHVRLKGVDAAERGGVVFSGHLFGAISHVIGPAFHLGMPTCPGSG